MWHGADVSFLPKKMISFLLFFISHVYSIQYNLGARVLVSGVTIYRNFQSSIDDI
jgi:hypothetical protein